MDSARAPALLFVPWPQPLAVGALLGVALASSLAPWLAATLGGLILALAALRQYSTRAPWPTSFDPRRPALLLGFLLPLAFGAGGGLLRAGYQQLQPEPLLALVGSQVTLTGFSDGSVLNASAPLRARVALVAPSGGWSGGVAPTGFMTVEGTLEAPPGRHNPGGFDYAAYLRRRGVGAQLFVQSFSLSSRVLPRQRVQRGVAAGLGPAAAALMTAMTLGVRDDLGELRNTFGAAGMAHLLALSGLHVGVLLLAVERLLRPLRRWSVPALALVLVGFVALVGTGPSVLRASTMALAALASRAFGAGRIQPWTALALAVLLGLMHAPQMLADLSFQLSYLAVAGMLLLLPPWLDRLGVGPGQRGGAQSSAAALADPELAALSAALWRRGRRALRHALLSGLAVSSAAQLPSLSVVLGSFGVLPLLSPLVNVIAVPLAGLLVPLGFLAGVLGLVALPLAHAVNLITRPLVAALIWLAEVGAHLPHLTWGEVSWLGHACWALFLLALCAWAWCPGRLRHTAAVALAAGGVALAVPPAQTPPDVWFLDVGQGDAVVIRLGGGQAVLVDGGGSPFSDFDVGERVVLPALRALGITRLAAVVATHADADHMEGLLPVVRSVPVGLLITGPPAADNALDQELRGLAATRRVPLHEARRGEQVVLQGGRVTLDVLNPEARPQSSSNERSVAFVLRYRGAARALFFGDLGVDTEADLAVPPAELLMVGHHGSRGSTSAALLRAASPRWAVISVGRNNYGHPSPEVLQRLAEAGVEVLTTQLHGAVRYDLRAAGSAPRGLVPQGAPHERGVTYP
ncbi:MAG: DNA internalization-related competence protein ComEC/Rec2 [Trueperaceae bacterium]